MSFYSSVSFSFILELKNILNSPYKVALISWLPLISFILIAYIFSSGLVKSLPIAVVDMDNSHLSQMLKGDIEASASLSIKYTPLTMKRASSLLSKGDVYAIVYIKEHFEKEVYLHQQPKIIAMINTQYILIGKNIESTLFKIVSSSSAKIDFVKNLVKEKRFSAALNSTEPIRLAINGYFNKDQNYFYFLVSALIPAIWQIFIVVASIVSIGVLFKEGKAETFFSKGNVSALLIGKMLPYTLAYFTWGILFLLGMYGYEGWYFQGSYAITLFAMLLNILAYQVIALFIFSLSFDYARSLSLGAVYTAPAFAFLGITFPTNNMPIFATLWHNILPVSHYMQLQISQANYGTNILEMFPYLGILCLFFMLWPFVIWRFKKQMKDRS